MDSVLLPGSATALPFPDARAQAGLPPSRTVFGGVTPFTSSLLSPTVGGGSTLYSMAVVSPLLLTASSSSGTSSVLISTTDLSSAVAVLEQLRQDVSSVYLPLAESTTVDCAGPAGSASLPPLSAVCVLREIATGSGVIQVELTLADRVNQVYSGVVLALQVGGGGQSPASAIAEVDVSSMLLFHSRLPPSLWFEASLVTLAALHTLTTLRTLHAKQGDALCSGSCR